MRLTAIGCSPAWPNPGGAHAGFLVEGAGTLLLDCGPGVLARLREREPWPRVDAIAITHFHLDHFGDLVPWVWGSRHGPGRDVVPPQLYVPPGGRARLAAIAGQLGHGSMFDEAFEIVEFADGEPFTAAGFRLTARRVQHYDEEAYGFTVESGAKRLAYSGDTGPTPALAELARDTDLFLCESTLERAEDDSEPRGHLSPAEAAEAFAASGARRLVLVHRPVDLEGGAFELARDGLVVEV